MVSNVVYGIADNILQSASFDWLLESIAKEGAGIPGMEITKEMISTFLHRDCSQYRLGEEIHVRSFMYSGFQRTPLVRLRFAQMIVEPLARFVDANLEQCSSIFVIVETDSAKDDAVCIRYHKNDSGQWVEMVAARRPLSLV